MKKLITCIASLFLIFFTSVAQLNYTLVTNGLTDQYESGQCEFKLGDIDRDGDIDIISVGDHMSPLISSEHGIMVFKNNGDGTFWTKTMLGNFGYGGVALGDVNNDGNMDVAYGIHHNYNSTDFGDQVLEVVLGDGTGNSWTPYDDNLGMQGQNWGMFGCDFADINNDGLCWTLDQTRSDAVTEYGCILIMATVQLYGSVYAGALDLNSSSNFLFGDH
jgi:hypothetical protein